MKNFIKTSAFIFLYLAIYIVYQIKISVIAGIIGAFLGMGSSQIMSLMIPMLLPAALISLVFYYLIMRTRKIKLYQYCKFKKIDFLTVILIIVTVLGFSIFIQPIVEILTKLFPSYNEINKTFTEASNNVFSILCITLLIPIFEEILFRGMILNDIKRKINVTAAVFIQGVLFGVYHMNIVQGIYAAFLGIILGFIYVWTESIISTIIAHITFNISGVAIFPYLFQNSSNNVIIFSCFIGLIVAIATLLFMKKVNENKIHL